MKKKGFCKKRHLTKKLLSEMSRWLLSPSRDLSPARISETHSRAALSTEGAGLESSD